MAQIYPSLENIKRLKVQPTEGEEFLIKYLIKNLSDNVEIYFKPFINGDIPNFILIEKNIGVTIIEVKEWDLKEHSIEDDGTWNKKNSFKNIKSPFEQVKEYKDNLFDLHIKGLLELKLLHDDRNKSIYGKIKTIVYFHKVLENELNEFISNQNISVNIENEFKFCAVTYDKLRKITLPKYDDKNILNDAIYKEFLRYLQPPIHTLEMGKNIEYTDEQKKLIKSTPGFQKIKGVAGSGKTSILAKRAVNAHMRHKGRILILTYNITLVNYIQNKINDVKEMFSWDNFYIINYHEFFKQNLNFLGIEVKIPKEILADKTRNLFDQEKDEIVSEYLNNQYYSNRRIFEEYSYGLNKYKSIFIDELQDYSPDWIDIIKNFMLEENGEMVLFGDEKQDIYGK